MTMGRPVADLDDFLEVAPDPVLRAAPASPPDPPANRRERWWWIVGGVAVIIAAAVAFWWLQRPEPVVAQQPAASPAHVVPAGVPGFAAMYVAAYLTGETADIAEFLPGAPPVAAMVPAARYVTRTAAMEVGPVADHYWSVVVAADVLVLEAGGYVADGLHYYQVGVIDDGGRLVAAALPSRVAAPPIRLTAPRSLQVADQPASAEHAALAGDFLEALLIGTRDIGRYATVDSGIVAVSPAPYDAITISAVSRFGDTATLLATVEATEPGGAVATLQYVLEVAGEGGRLLVSSVLAGPPPIDLGSGS